jgi:Fe-S-cluster containining protein
MLTRYKDLCAAWDAEFQRNREIYGARLRCGPGCSDCCHQLFQITEIEAGVIRSGVNTLPVEQREVLLARARAYLPARQALSSRIGVTEAWGSLPPQGARLACPALIDGICAIYEHRPLICRKFGIPLYHPARPNRVAACELNFRDGDEIVDGGLIQIHTRLHQQALEMQAYYNDAGGMRDPEPITVARAILEDFPASAQVSA